MSASSGLYKSDVDGRDQTGDINWGLASMEVASGQTAREEVRTPSPGSRRRRSRF